MRKAETKCDVGGTFPFAEGAIAGVAWGTVAEPSKDIAMTAKEISTQDFYEGRIGSERIKRSFCNCGEIIVAAKISEEEKQVNNVVESSSNEMVTYSRLSVLLEMPAKSYLLVCRKPFWA